MKSSNYDVIIIGGGIMGSSTAYNLIAEDPSLKVIVIERDLSYEKSSTTLSMVNARIQFSLKENVLISQYAFDVLENFEEKMAVDGKKLAIFYRREGNLFLYDEKSLLAAKRAFQMQKDLGCAIEWWSPGKIKDEFPIYENLDDIEGASFGPEDGHFDAYSVLMGYKAKAKSMGVEFVQDDVVELITSAGAISSVKTGSNGIYFSSHVVNCTGAWANLILKTVGIKLPMESVKRQVFAVKHEVKLDYPLPLTILPSGFYFRTETGGLLLLGKSMEEDPAGFDFTWDNERFEHLWGELYEFAPVFEALKLIKGWAGLYAVNIMDANAILGEWPEIKGLYLANGFSGHGLQQGPAVGRYMTELIIGKTPTLDLSVFSPLRIFEKNPIKEDGIV
ncbi:MAG: FAD-binding oxidoreductase [Thermodesulfobacteriota bacterium]